MIHQKRILFSTLFMSVIMIHCTDNSLGSENPNPEEEVTYPTSEAISSIPRPTMGKRWVLIEELSDEFDGNTLDSDKWYDYHPSWKGRPPGLFMSEQISVSNGCLILEGGKLEAGEQVTVKSGYDGSVKTTTVTAVDEWSEGDSGYNIKCAAVVNKSITAHYDTYYECRVKANKTLLSTTFWLSMHNGQVDATGNQPGTIWNGGTFGQELDILECIGRSGDFAGYYFSEGMHSNAHLWFKEGGMGTSLDFRAASSTLTRSDGGIPSDDYNTYGCWWVDESKAKYYLNNDQSSDMDFIVSTLPSSDYSSYMGSPFSFTEELGMNLVMETYTWFYETEEGSNNAWSDRVQNADGSYNLVLPTDEELEDPTKNKTYYDWVRCYKLRDISYEPESAVDYVMFDNHIYITDKPETLSVVGDCVSITAEYTASKDSEIEFAIYDADDKLLTTQVESALAGFGYNEFNIDVRNCTLTTGATYYAVARLRAEGSEDNSAIYEGDSFEFTLQ